jgi:hypothetical protein
MRMPEILWPAVKSSDRIRVAPHSNADDTISASQKPIRASSSELRGGQLELTVGFGPTQARLPGGGDLIETADAGCVRGMLHEVGLGCRFRGDRAHGIDE